MLKQKKKTNTGKKSPYEIFTESQITEAFEIFEEDRKGKAKLKHLGTFIRAMGRVPTVSNLEDLASEIEDPEIPGYFRLEKLLQPLTKILLKDHWKSSSKEELIKAFRILDSDRKGFLEREYVKKLSQQHIKNVPEEEIEKLLLSATSDNCEKISYKEYCEELVAPQLFDIAESRRKIREKLVDDRYRLC